MRRLRRLSHIIEEGMPLYPDSPPVSIKKLKDMRKGDSCNTHYISMSNHAGTHIDLPAHFIDGGRSVDAILPNECIFTRPAIVPCPKKAGEPIRVEEISAALGNGDYDLILIKTMFSEIRSTDPNKYCRNNPGLVPDTASWLRREYPSLRAVGIDCISIGQYSDKAARRLTHSILLDEDPADKRYIMILEDICIPEEMVHVDEVMVFPIYFKGGDAAPCTVIGVSND